MKTKTCKRLLAILLTLGTLAALCAMPAWAADASTDTSTAQTPPDNWKLTMPEPAKWGEGDFAHEDYPAGSGVEYMWFYQGTNPAVTDITPGFHNEWKSDSSAGEFRNYIPKATHVFYYGHWFAPQYHFSPTVVYTAPYTGLLTIKFQYALDRADMHIAVGKEANFATGDANYWTKALKVFNQGTPGDDGWVHASVTLAVTAGEKVYFVIDHENNGNMATLWFNEMSYANIVPGGYANDNGELDLDSLRLTTYTNDAFRYVYYYQGTDPDVKDLQAGLYDDMISKGGKNVIPKNELVYNQGTYFAPQYHFCPGVAFRAPYTGTVNFTYKYALGSTDHSLVITKADQFGGVTKDNASEWFKQAALWQHSYTNSGWNRGSITLDVKAGEDIYFLFDNISNGQESNLWIETANYVYADLKAQPATLMGVQECKDESGKMAVRFLAALGTTQFDEAGFAYSVAVTKTSDSTQISKENEKTIAVKSFGDSYTVKSKKDVTTVSAVQDTKIMAAIVEDLPTEDATVVITVYAYVRNGESVTKDVACVITYVDGVFQSIANVAN